MRHPRNDTMVPGLAGFWSRMFPARERRKSRPRRLLPAILALETRQLLSGVVASQDPGGMEAQYLDPKTGQVFELDAAPPLPSDLAGAASDNPVAASPSGARYPLSSVPVLNSLPGARASIYLDFVGDYEASWGAYSQISSPAFDTDGNPNTFSDSELAAIKAIWSYVAEDYAPFDINVTTVAPPSFDNGVSEKMVIGGDGSWMGQTYGGISYVGSFSNDMPNVSFVFSKNLGNGNARYTADATSHEAGHDFGLNHQSTYNGTAITQEYSTGPGNGIAPLMGNSYYAGRSTWWDGASDVSSTTYQDDMAVIAGAANGFGYRPESAGTTIATATLISENGDQVSASGVILTGEDVNDYTVLASAGPATFVVNAAAGYNNLVPQIQLYDATGTTLLASASAPTNGYSATISYTFGEAGGYRLVVRSSDRSYGNAGQYSIAGTIVPPPTSLFVTAPSNLSANLANPSQVVVSWTEYSQNETGFNVLRSANGGGWTTIASNLPAGTTIFDDTAVAQGNTYAYQVVAFNAAMTSSPSNTASAAVPLVVTAPPVSATGLSVTSRSSHEVTISWSDNADNEEGYEVQRSANGGKTWSTIADLPAESSTYTDRAVKGSKRYQYRIIAFNSKGTSAPSNLASTITPRFAVTHQTRAAHSTGRPYRFANSHARKALRAGAIGPRFAVDWSPVVA